MTPRPGNPERRRPPERMSDWSVGITYTQVVVAALTPAHHYLSGRGEFNPEGFEIHMHGDRWCLAVIRWMRTRPDLSLKFGASLIPGATRAVAVRGIEGHGAHTQYQRCIVLSADDASHSYIVPAGLFHVGSLLLLNDGEKLELLRLSRLAEMTKSYNRYLAEPLELNEARHEQVVQSLYRLLYSSEQ